MKLDLKNLRSTMVTVVMVAITLRIVLWALLPLVPYLISGIVFLSALIAIFGILWKRSSKL